MANINSIGVLIRKATDISAKVKAAFLGGVSAGGVTSILAAVFPEWHPATWLVGLITLAVALGAAYFKADTVTLTTTNAAGTVTSTNAVDMGTVPAIAVDGTPAVLAADESGKHVAP